MLLLSDPDAFPVLRVGGVSLAAVLSALFLVPGGPFRVSHDLLLGSAGLGVSPLAAQLLAHLRRVWVA
jgi:hypothetical protein